MKTLDEVIEAISFCKSGDLSKCKDCPYISTCEVDYAVLSDDALHYLREYRDKHDEMLKTEEALGYCEMAENRPLTWGELRTMEGKPVWFEVTDPKALPALDSGWGIVGCTSFTTWEGVKSFSLVKVGVTYAVPIALYGRVWNVYRKERE